MRKQLPTENKLVILFLLYQMDMPMSLSQMAEFAVDGEHMDYFSFSQYLHELEDEELVQKKYENDNDRYLITDEGEKALSFFSKQIPDTKRSAVLDFTTQNKRRIKREFSVVANYFYNRDNDYVVKCGVYEDSSIIMEINVSVATKEDAKLLKKNWKNNISQIYDSVMHTLLTPPDNTEENPSEIAEALSENKNKK